MATTQSSTPAELRQELLDGMPEGFEDLFDLTDPEGPGPLFTALGQLLAAYGTDRVDQLRDELCPLTCSSDTLRDWEAALGLDVTRWALTADVTTRRRQVLARLREWGAPSLDLIRRVLYLYLGYSSPSQVVILESDRQAVREEHTYRWRGYRYITALAPTTQITFQVKDGGKVAPGCPQLDLGLVMGELRTLSVGITGPGGESASVGTISQGAASSPRTWAAVANPATVAIRGVWFASSTDGWAVGDGGLVMRWNGSAWSAIAPPVPDDLYGVWGASATAVWAVGVGGIIIKWDGTSWNVVASPVGDDLRAVWGLSASNVYACGANGAAIHWDGTNWADLSSPTAEVLNGVWGSAANSVYFVGDAGTLLLWDTVAWTGVASGTGSDLFGIHGTAETDIWISGAGGLVIRKGPLGGFASVGSTGTAADLFAILCDGQVEPGVAFPVSTSVWVAGSGGVMRQWNGAEWAAASRPTTAQALRALAKVSSSDLWVAGGSAGAPILWRLLDSTTGRLRVYFPGLQGVAIDGTWTVTIGSPFSDVTVTHLDLFVEGLGLDTGGANGRGSAALWWGVMFEEEKVSMVSYDLDAARAAVRRLTMACRWSNILRRSSGVGKLGSGDFRALPDDPGSLPDAAIPG